MHSVVPTFFSSSKHTKILFLYLTTFLSLMSRFFFHLLCLPPFSHTLMHYRFMHTCVCLFVCIYVCVGGEGKVGKVVDIRGWDTESGRSVASVTWSNGTTNVYRMGHKGKVDLKYVSDGQGGFYYKDHLPKLGKTHGMHSLVFFISQLFKECHCKIRLKAVCLTDLDLHEEFDCSPVLL